MNEECPPLVNCCLNAWGCTQVKVAIHLRATEKLDHEPHVWDTIEPVWAKIIDRVWTKQPTGLPYDALYRRLFLHEYTQVSRWLENSYRGKDWRWVQTWFREQAVARFPSQWVSTLYLYGLDQLDALAWQWMDQHENLLEQVWHTWQGTFRRKRPPDVRDDPMRSH